MPRGTGNNTRTPVSRSRSRSDDDKLRYTEWYLPRTRNTYGIPYGLYLLIR